MLAQFAGSGVAVSSALGSSCSTVFCLLPVHFFQFFRYFHFVEVFVFSPVLQAVSKNAIAIIHATKVLKLFLRLFCFASP